MKLIDKEALLLALRKKRYSKQSLDLIESQPVVDAIPVAWLKKYMNKVDIEDCGMVYLSPSAPFRDMLNEWEKENETN